MFFFGFRVCTVKTKEILMIDRQNPFFNRFLRGEGKFEGTGCDGNYH
jgi:hypothetical protein